MLNFFKGSTQPITKPDMSDEEAPLAPGFVVATRNAWYRDMYRHSIKLNLMLSFGLVLAIAAAGYFYQAIPDPVYFATTKNGKLIKLAPLNKPNLSRDAVSQWAVQAVSHTMSFSWVNYKEHLTSSCNTYFTDAGCT